MSMPPAGILTDCLSPHPVGTTFRFDRDRRLAADDDAREDANVREDGDDGIADARRRGPGDGDAAGSG